jgi:hypothetical protein
MAKIITADVTNSNPQEIVAHPATKDLLTAAENNTNSM